MTKIGKDSEQTQSVNYVSIDYSKVLKVEEFINSTTTLSKEEQAKVLADYKLSLKQRMSQADNSNVWVDGLKKDYQEHGALGMIPHRINDGLNTVKDPIKDFSHKVDAKLDDHNNDGKLSVAKFGWEVVKVVGNAGDAVFSAKGLALTALPILATVAFPATVAALTPTVIAGTGTVGTVLFGKGTYNIITAKTDNQACKGIQTAGTGAMMLFGSVSASKLSLQGAEQAGIETNYTPDMNPFSAFIENIRIAPKGIGVAIGISKPVIGAAIPDAAIKFESKPNTPECYVTTGKADGIVFEKDGKLFVPNKWNPEAPYEVSKGSVIMKYDVDDFAVCDPKIFSKTYVDEAGIYADPANLKPGEAMRFTKKALGGFEIVPEGTSVKTLEGDVVVKTGQAQIYDVDGNPYVGDIEKSLLKRNVPVDAKSKETFEILKEYSNAASTPDVNKSALHEGLVNVTHDNVEINGIALVKDASGKTISYTSNQPLKGSEYLDAVEKFKVEALEQTVGLKVESYFVNQNNCTQRAVTANFGNKKVILAKDIFGSRRSIEQLVDEALMNYDKMINFSTN